VVDIKGYKMKSYDEQLKEMNEQFKEMKEKYPHLSDYTILACIDNRLNGVEEVIIEAVAKEEFNMENKNELEAEVTKITDQIIFDRNKQKRTRDKRIVNGIINTKETTSLVDESNKFKA